MTAPTHDLSILPVAAILVATGPVRVSTDVSAQSDTLELIGTGIGRMRAQSPFPWIDFGPDSVAIITGAGRLCA